MLLYFFLGMFFGVLLMLAIYLTARSELARQEEANEVADREKQIILNFLHHLIEGISQGKNKEEVYRRILHESIMGTGGLSACIYELNENNKLTAISREGLFPPLKTESIASNSRTELLESTLANETFAVGEGIIGAVALSQKSLWIENAALHSKLIKHKDPALKVNSLLLAPLRFREKLFGVLAVANSTRSEQFSSNEFSLLQSFAEQAGIVLHNAQLMSFQIEKNKLDFDLKLASNIQNLLLIQPESIRIPNFDLSIHYQSAQKIGGDLYDIVPLSPKKFAIIIADVSGKGISASLLMTICLTHIKHYAFYFDSPRKVLSILNKDLYQETRKDMFITMVYAILDIESNTLTVARAGHECPLLYETKASNSIVSPIDPKGMALGMVANEIFDTILEEKTYHFAENHACVFYTDGVTEALNSKEEEFSQTHLIDVIERNRSLSAKELNSVIMKNIRNFSGSKQLSDDLTLITLRRL